MIQIVRAREIACAVALAICGGCVTESHHSRSVSHRHVVPRGLAAPSAPRSVAGAPSHWNSDLPHVEVADQREPSKVQVTSHTNGASATQSALKPCRPVVRHAAVEHPAIPTPTETFQSQNSNSSVETEIPVTDGTPLDLSSALVMAAGRNPQVAFAQERIRAAEARTEAAESLWLPSLRAGLNWYKHEGTLQDVRGPVSDITRVGMYTGLGARAIGAANPAVPGVSAQFHFTDAVFQPKIACRIQNARGWAAEAARNDVLMDTALAYIELLAAWQTRAVTQDTLRNAEALALLTKNFAESGQGPQADADRAATELALRRNAHEQADEDVATSSARLAELLSLDPTVTVLPQETVLTPVELVSLAQSPQELVGTALSNRPELQENANLVAAAVQRLKREKYAPLLPSVLLGASYGGFGGGTEDNITDYRDRFDVEATAWWEVRNLGRGESAARREAESGVRREQFRQMQTMDRVAREVVEAHAQVAARHKQIATAQAGVESAQLSFRRNRDRIRDGQGLPLEVLQSLQALDEARRSYIRAVTRHNTAQFRLQRALGWPIQ